VKHFLILLAVVFSLNSLAVVDFAEAQLQISKDSNGKRQIEIEYNQEREYLRVEYKVEWFNYDAETHQSGFHLSRSYRMFIDNPELRGCRVLDFGGILYAPNSKKESRVYFVLEGDRCQSYIKTFEKTWDPSLSYYGVPFLTPVKDSVNALKLMFLF
jgi:hypothetical protein